MRKFVAIFFVAALCFGIACNASAVSYHPESVITDFYYAGENYNDNRIEKINSIEVDKIENEEHQIPIYTLSIDTTNFTVTFTSTVQVDYISIKVSNGFIVYEVEDSSPYSGTFSYKGLLGPGGEQAGFSHATLFTDGRDVPVPAPAAVWLLGTGLVGLVGVRRKMKK